MRADDLPFYGPVEHEAVYYLTPKRAIRIPPPPTMFNDGNYIASMSRLSRWLAERAEELGVTIVPETAAAKLLVTGGRVVGVRTGDRGRGKDGGELPNFEPGSDIVARVDDPRRGHARPPDPCGRRSVRPRRGARRRSTRSA